WPMTASVGVGRPSLFALLVGAAVLCATMAMTAAFDSADARGSGGQSYYRGHRAGAYDRARFHHQGGRYGGRYYGNFYRSNLGTFYNPPPGLKVRGGRGVQGGGHYFEGYR